VLFDFAIKQAVRQIRHYLPLAPTKKINGLLGACFSHKNLGVNLTNPIKGLFLQIPLVKPTNNT